MDAHENVFQLCEPDEQVIRTYACTGLKRLFYPKTIGYLTITNKRVVFHSSGKSFLGKSVLVNEMPLEDTAGVRSYLDVSVNWLVFAIFCILAFLISKFLSSLIPITVFWVLGILFVLPFIGIWILNSNLLDDRARRKVFSYINQRFENKIQAEGLFPILVPTARVFFFIGVLLLGWAIVSTRFFLQLFPLNYLLLAVVYFFVFLYSFGQRRSFSLMIASKTMKGSGINIPGSDVINLLTRDNTAPGTLGAGAEKDAERVTREIGAVLMDIRQMGDLGIQKWKA
jgi:hypothetical protein